MAAAATLAVSSQPERVRIHFRCLGVGCDDVEYATETVKIWISGFLMRSRKTLASGTMLYLRLRVPTELSGSPFCELSTVGRVVSEHELDDGTVGYSVEIERPGRSESTINLAH